MNPYISTTPTQLPPLCLGQVLEGRPIAASTSPLFWLPAEILARIAFFMDSPAALASLAQVNSDCRQIARSCQFRVVKLDCSRQSCELVRLLMEEADERLRSPSRLTDKPSLGVCIRQLHVYTHSAEPDTREVYRSLFVSVCMHVLPTLPNLQVLGFGREVDTTYCKNLFKNLSTTKVKRLAMRVVRSGLDNIVPPLANDIVKWPLTTLNLDIEDCNGALKAILQASASTLKTLKLHGKWDMPIADIPKFISLRYLDVERTRELQPGVIEHILRNSRLQTLIFNADQREPLTRLADVGPLSSLTTLILTGNWHHNSEYRGPFPYLQTLTRILEQNHQLVTLAIHITTLSPATDVTAIISVIAHFPCLEKLSLPLEYRDDDYPSFQPLSTLPKLKILSLVMRYTKDSRVDKTDTIMVPLRTLSSLVSLEVLHMTDDWLSFSMGTRAYDTLKKILLPLRKLRVVSFQGALSWIPEGFLPGPVPIIGTINREGQVRFPLGGAQQSWGRNIKKRASVVCAMAWANSFPELESISFRSQLPSIIHSFNIKRESGGKHIMRAVPLGAKNAERSTQRRLNEIVSRHFSE